MIWMIHIRYDPHISTSRSDRRESFIDREGGDRARRHVDVCRHGEPRLPLPPAEGVYTFHTMSDSQFVVSRTSVEQEFHASCSWVPMLHASFFGDVTVAHGNDG